MIAWGEAFPVKVAAELNGQLGVPDEALGLVLLAYGDGRAHLRQSDGMIPAMLRGAGLATLWLDLLKPSEKQNTDHLIDNDSLAQRMHRATEWAVRQPDTAWLPVGYFGAGIGAEAALLSAAHNDHVAAVVSCGAHPDGLADVMMRIQAPLLVIALGPDDPIIRPYHDARAHIHTMSELAILPSAGLADTNDKAVQYKLIECATGWFLRHLAPMTGRA